MPWPSQKQTMENIHSSIPSFTRQTMTVFLDLGPGATTELVLSSWYLELVQDEQVGC